MSRFEYQPNSHWDNPAREEAKLRTQEEYLAELKSVNDYISTFLCQYNLSSELVNKLQEETHTAVRHFFENSTAVFIKKKLQFHDGLPCYYRDCRQAVLDELRSATGLSRVNSYLYDSLIYTFARREELKILTKELAVEDVEQGKTDRAEIHFNKVLSKMINSYWMRRKLNIITDKSTEGINYSDSRGGMFSIQISKNYMNVVDANLEVVNAGGKQSFPITLEAVDLPKGSNSDYSLYKSKVVVMASGKLHSYDLDEYNSCVKLEERYICVCTTTEGKVVSCSTTPGRAVGGVNVKIKNKVMDELSFSF